MSGDAHFTLDGKNFSLSKIDATKQYHIVRRIGPLLIDLISCLGAINKKEFEAMSEVDKLEAIGKIAQPVMLGLSKLSDADSEYVLFRLLSAVQVEQPEFKTWAKVATEAGIVMQNLELPILLQIAGRSLMHNLKGFFALLPRQA